MEGPANKREEPSKKAPATSPSFGGRRGKEVSVNAVNTAHQASQQYSVDLATTLTAAPTYFPSPPQHQPQPIYYSAPLVPPATTSQSYDPYAPASAQSPQPRPPVSRAPPPAQQNPTSQGPQVAPGHTLDNYWRLRDEIQRRIDSNRLTFNAVRPPNVQANPLPDHRPSLGPSVNMISICISERDEEAQENPPPFVINYTPEELTVGLTGHLASSASFVVDIPARESYSDSRVPWTYEGSVGNVEQQFSVMGLTRSGRVYENPTAKDKGKAPAVENGATPESSPFPSKKVTEEEAEAFMKIVKMNVDLNRVRPSKIAVRAFDGSRREVNGEINLLIDVGPCSFSITFQVLDIPNAFSLLLGRPWIHSAGAVPSSLHQRLKFIVEEKLITEAPLMALLRTPTTLLPLRQPCSTRIQILDASIRTYPESKEPQPVYFGEGLPEDSQVSEIEESLRRLEDHQITSVEPTEEINMGTEDEPRTLKIGTALNPTQRARMIDFLKEYQEVFAWSYANMPGLDPSIVEHFLPLDTEKFSPKRQQLRRQRASLLLRIKEEVVKQINAGFLKVCNYSEWVGNIVPVEKKDGRVRICIDYRDLNKASPKDNFPLSHIDVLVDNTARHAQFSFMDDFSGYNQIWMAEKDKLKTMFTTMWGTFCYRVMPFGLKNAGATNQRAMVTLFHDMMHKEVECQNDQWRVRAYFRGILLKPGHPDPPRTSFLTELPRFAPLISERPLKTGLQAPRGHQDRGTSFRQLFGARLGFPRNVSVVTNASRRAFGAFPRKTEITTIPEHFKTFSEIPEKSRSSRNTHRTPLDVPFPSTTSESHAIMFKGFLTTLTLSREE
ncbi:hypothetical protein CRG98_044613, partial [Punica granatum]